MAQVDETQRPALQVISTKYPMDKLGLLETIRVRRGDRFISDTVRHALDKLVAEHFPGEEAA